nr:unnamed protein product [Callosobruchus analis]
MFNMPSIQRKNQEYHKESSYCTTTHSQNPCQ